MANHYTKHHPDKQFNQKDYIDYGDFGDEIDN